MTTEDLITNFNSLIQQNIDQNIVFSSAKDILNGLYQAEVTKLETPALAEKDIEINNLKDKIIALEQQITDLQKQITPVDPLITETITP